jgi:aspartyl-tRNA(Asn)/glutamyl-tRNA(Gln) amidotransferase subunit C
MPITRNDVAQAARLARLELSEAEMDQFGRELSAISDYVAQLARVVAPGESPPPVLPLIPTAEALRGDTVDQSLDVESALGNAPDRAGSVFRVPKVIG